jgi:hypothetical protein
MAIWPFLALFIAACSTPTPSPTTESPPVADMQAAPVTKETPLTEAPIDEPAPEPTPFVHTVRWPGETLSLVAKWYTGNYANWRRVAKANPTLNPHRIFVGNRIVIPEAILKTRTPMPRKLVAGTRPAPKKTPERSTSQKAPSDTSTPLPLFGPKGG